MKITISREFDTVDEAKAFLDSLLETRGPRSPQVKADEFAPIPPRRRKPRSDAGQPRGPYKKAAAEAPAETAVPERAADAEAPTSTKEADAGAGQQSETPTTDSSPTTDSTVPVPAEASGEPTLADIKAAMQTLARKRGIETNVMLLASFGVSKLSNLSEDKYAEFLAAVRAAVTA